jgi:hypothetical protein
MLSKSDYQSKPRVSSRDNIFAKTLHRRFFKNCTYVLSSMWNGHTCKITHNVTNICNCVLYLGGQYTPLPLKNINDYFKTVVFSVVILWERDAVPIFRFDVGRFWNRLGCAGNLRGLLFFPKSQIQISSIFHTISRFLLKTTLDSCKEPLFFTTIFPICDDKKCPF